MSMQLDHRQIADEMEIFFFDQEIGAGLPIWLPNGVVIREVLEKYIQSLEKNYQRVVSPHIAQESLFAKSGHLAHYAEGMFPPMRGNEEKVNYFLKPMNCPFHHKVFSSSLRSYRQLPYRVSEYGQVYRFENSGSLHGLSRVRALCQNDAHIYVNPELASEEIERVLDLHEKAYAILGLKNYRYRLSLGDRNSPDKFIGEDKTWVEAEEILRSSLQKKKLFYFEAKGEAAFYGPKIDVQMLLAGKEESVASIQLDFNSAEKFDLSYIAPSGERKEPWVIHRAPLGSHERFIAMLLEYYQGQLPLWLCPSQVLIIPVMDSHRDFAHKIVDDLVEAGARAKLDEGVGSLSKRIRSLHKFRPFSKIVIGDEEIASGKIKWQFRDHEIAIWRSNLLDEWRKVSRKHKLPCERKS